MNYQLSKHITFKKRPAIEKIVAPVIFVIMIPVALIAFLSSLLVSFFVFIKGLLIKKENFTEPYHEELTLINNMQLKVVMVEDEKDEELNLQNDAWAAKVFGQHTYLYRIRTSPVIHELHGSICGYYLLENGNGAFLQQLHPENSEHLHTRMLFLNYHSNTTEVVGDIGAFYLYNDEKSGEIKGFNENQKILIEITPFAPGA